jgi:hypothetical protein
MMFPPMSSGERRLVEARHADLPAAGHDAAFRVEILAPAPVPFASSALPHA